MQSWQAVPGEILNLELRSGSSQGATKGVVFCVLAEYQYSVDDNTYIGERVGVDKYGYSDSVNNYHESMHRALKRAQRNDDLVVWVNPDDPSESVLDREIRWELVRFLGGFALAFGGGGLLFIAVGLRRFKDPSFLKPDR